MSLHIVNTSNLCWTNSRMSALPLTTIDLLFNWYLVSLSPTKVWPLLFVKVTRYPNSIKLVRCSLLKRSALLQRWHRVLHLPRLLVIQMTLMKFLIIPLPTAILRVGRGTRTTIIIEEKIVAKMVVVEAERGVPTEGVMRVVVVQVAATTVAMVARLAVATVVMVGSSQ